MRLTVEQYQQWSHKSVTLVGMSGVGKTHLSNTLRRSDWFHYSGDYRIGARYLDEAILDMIKEQAMQVPFLRDLFRKDWIYMRNNITVDDLGPVLAFVGKLGNPELGGVALKDFTRRQEQYRQAEIAAMHDVPEFIRKAHEIYGYSHFVNDVGGSLCELDEPGLLDVLAQHSLILYIQVTTPAEEQKLIDRAKSDPKPLYYRADFLQEQLEFYLQETGLANAESCVPDDFTRWIFPRLFHSRIPRYEKIAEDYGYTVTSEEVAQVQNEADFNKLIEMAIARHPSE